MVEFGGKIYSSPSLVNEEEFFAEWRIFKRALAKEKKTMMEKKVMSKPPSLQDVKTGMEFSKAIRYFVTLPVVTATVERSFSQMKFVKTRLRNRLSDINLARLMRIVIEGPELTSVHLMKFWMYVYKEQYRRIAL